MDIESIKIMCKQLVEGDYSVFEIMQEVLEEEFEPGQESQVMMLLDKTFHDMGKEDVSQIQSNLAIYATTYHERSKKFYMWVNDLLEDYKKDSDLLRLHVRIDKASKNIESLTDDAPALDRLGIANIIMMIGDLE